MTQSSRVKLWPILLQSFEIRIRTETADQLARMYAADQGLSDDLPSAEERTALADYLGCHEEARAAAWAAWSAELNPADWDAAQYWLDVEFIEPCPEHQV